MSTADAQAALTALSRWIDAGNADRDPEALHLHRVIKVGEEAGEVVSALIGWLGANPRKGQTHNLDDVIEELLDVAVTALGAIEHLTEHDGTAMHRLAEKILRVAGRVGLTGDDVFCPCLPPDHGYSHYKSEHDHDCGGQTFDPPCGGCMGCIVAQIGYYESITEDPDD